MVLDKLVINISKTQLLNNNLVLIFSLLFALWLGNLYTSCLGSWWTIFGEVKKIYKNKRPSRSILRGQKCMYLGFGQHTFPLFILINKSIYCL